MRTRDDPPGLFDDLPPSPAPARPSRSGDRDHPLSVAAVVHGAGAAVDAIGILWVEGETLSVRRHASGHVYFVLKDEGAQLAAVMWRSDAQRLRFRLDSGMRVRCRGRLGVYDREGKFQMYVGFAEPAGLGAEALALDQLKSKLAAEGLFETARKRALPRLPRRIGVVTSRNGAAVRDIVRVVHRRCPVPILVADTLVQGSDAPRAIVAALRAIVRHRVDLVIVGRGGGSASDLAAFNDEAVVRAVAACPVPIISAVGHEVDVTLTDLAADHRAATPSMAGELAVPVLDELSAQLAKEERRLAREIEVRMRSAHQEIDRLGATAATRIALALAQRKQALAVQERRLAVLHPRARLVAHRAALRELLARGTAALARSRDARARRFGELAGRLQALSPLQVLDRGYALAHHRGHLLTDATAAAPGDPITVTLAAGRLDCHVEAVHPAQAGDDDEEA